jgi:DNA-binding transcriptional LysR family regulator
VGDVDLGDVEVFVRVVEAGSFSGAARATRVPKSSVSRRVRRLEDALGTRLLQRTTRSLTLTEAGRDFHARVAGALDRIREAGVDAALAGREPRGAVRMTAPPDVGAELLPGLLAGFVAAYPTVRVDVHLDPDPPGLVEGGYDLALRAGRPAESTGAAVVLQEVPFRLYASPSLLLRHPEPRRTSDLAHLPCVLFRARGGRARWRLSGPDGEEEVIAVSGPISADDMTFVRRAAIAGAGVALLPELVGERAVATGRLQPVLADRSSTGIPLHLVHPSATYVPLHVRALRDYLLDRFPQAGVASRPSATSDPTPPQT